MKPTKNLLLGIAMLEGARNEEDVSDLSLSYVKSLMLIPTEGDGDLNPRTSVVMSVCMTILRDAMGPKEAADALRWIAANLDMGSGEAVN